MEDLLILKNEDENRKIGFLSSVMIHLLLLLICLLPLFNYQKPPQRESGVLVSFGEIYQGVEIESAQENTVEKAKKLDKNKPTKPVSGETEKQVVESTKTNQIIATVIAEEAPIVLNESDVSEKIEVDVEKNRKIEAAKAAAKEEDYHQKKSTFSSLFDKEKDDDSVTGNQGQPRDEPNADALKSLSKGNGKIGGGITSRDVLHEPIVEDSSQKTGVVVVKVCIDNIGNVTEAEFTQKGSSTTDRYLVQKAILGAKKYKFNPAKLELQCGTIAFDFKVR